MIQTRKEKRPGSLAEVARLVNQGTPSVMAVCEFLDEFYAADPLVKPLMLADEPEPLQLKDDREAIVKNAYFSAVAEMLAYRHGITAPSWIFQKKFFLENPWFATDIQGLWPLLLAESPVFFRRRNLFVSANALSRA